MVKRKTKETAAVFTASQLAVVIELVRKQPQRASTPTPPTTTRRLEVMKARTA